MQIDLMLMISTAFACGILACALLVRPESRTPANMLLSGAVALLGVGSIDDYLQTSDSYGAAIGFVGYGIMVLPIVSPLMYLHIEALLARNEWRLEYRHWIHFLVPLVCAIAIGPFLMLAPDIRKNYMLDVNEHRGAATLVGVVLAYLLMVAQQATYLFKVRQLLSTDDGTLDQSTISRIVWLRGLHIILVICWCTFLTSFVSGFFGAKLSALIANSAATVFLGAILAIGVLGLVKADALVRAPIEFMTNLVASGHKRYARSALNDGDMDRLAAKLQHALEHGQVFLDPTLSLPILAAKMGTNTNDLSQLMNARLGQNFYQLINAARIKHAVALMKSGNHTGTLLELGFESGFNSKSVFNAAFKREIGLTPSQWKATAPTVQDS